MKTRGFKEICASEQNECFFVVGSTYITARNTWIILNSGKMSDLSVGDIFVVIALYQHPYDHEYFEATFLCANALIGIRSWTKRTDCTDRILFKKLE